MSVLRRQLVFIIVLTFLALGQSACVSSLKDVFASSSRVILKKGKKSQSKKPSKPSKPSTKTANKSKKPKKTKEDKKIVKGFFDWPHAGPLTSGYGPRWGRMHEGIDIGAKTGDPVRASAAGTVKYAGVLGAYGNLVLIKHKKNNFYTAYAHNSKIKVKEGKKVRKGEVVALAGSTGRSTGPHVHFEIRKGTKPVDPYPYLPKR